MKLESVRASLLTIRKCTVLSGAMLMLTGLSACEMAGKGSAQAGPGEAEPCGPKAADTPEAPAGIMRAASPYDRHVLGLKPTLYLPLGASPGSTAFDMSGNDHTASFLPANNTPDMVVMPNGDMAASFNGQDQYVEVPSSPALSVTYTGCLTVQVWIRPATLQFPREEGTGYVYILGKGTSGEYEYAIRMYSKVNREDPERPNRISGYVWNLAGGLGSGAYFQDPVEIGQWIMVTVVIYDRPSKGWPDGYVALYKDAELRDQVSLSQYDVTPQAGNAPFCIGTRNNDSYFEGAIGKVAVYDQVLSASSIAATYNAMFATEPVAGGA